MIIGVTGGMGAGKSFVSNQLGRRLGLEVLDADRLCRQQLQPNMPGWWEVWEKWGARFIDSSGKIDRFALRQALFADLRVRQAVERILHPLVRAEIARRAAERNVVSTGLLVEVPLLFEVGWEDDFDWIVVVYAKPDRCLQRIVRRDQVSIDEGERAIKAQIPLEEKVVRGDSVIDNSGPPAWALLQIQHLARVLEDGAARKLLAGDSASVVK